jgi:hypothetical protein
MTIQKSQWQWHQEEMVATRLEKTAGNDSEKTDGNDTR